MVASFSEVSEALYCIPPDVERDTWYRLAAAVRDALGDGGFDVFDSWSQGAGSYDAKDTKSVWNSFRGNSSKRPITVATLFKTAMEYGYQNRKKEVVTVKRSATKKPMRQKPASKSAAQKYWGGAHECDNHPYAERKQVDTAGLKKYKAELLIPAYDESGALSSIQKIAKDGGKKFLSGCAIAGCWYILPGDATVVVAEGWATAKSIHQATGHTCVICFSCNFFDKVLAAVKRRYPDGRVVIAPDNDEHQHAVKAATKTARDHDVEIIVPQVEQGSDFNDVHVESGLDEVRLQFKKNIEKPRLHELNVLQLSSVTMRAVEWLWPGKFAFGKLCLLGGQPSTGKTTIAQSIIAILTTGGKWPFSQHRAKRGRCVILTAEDDPEDTVVPRLVAAGADLERVSMIMASGDGRQFSLARDIEQLDGFLKEFPDTRLVVFDPLSAYLGADDSHRDADVRQVLGPLSQLAAGHHITVLGITHLSKDEGKSAMARFMGSTGIIAASRSAYLTARIDNEMMLLPVKNNLAPPGESHGLSYKINSTIAGDSIPTSVVEWTGTTTMWADEALRLSAGKQRGKLMDAKEFLADMLTAGPQLQETLVAAAHEKDIAWATVRRAKNELKYESHKDGFDGQWKWYSAQQWKKVQQEEFDADSNVLKQETINEDAQISPADEHLRKMPKNSNKAPPKAEDTQQQNIGHLRVKTPTSASPKAASHIPITEGAHRSEEFEHLRENGEPEKSPKVLKSLVVGNSGSDQEWEVF